jgi:hypothetical protein
MRAELLQINNEPFMLFRYMWREGGLGVVRYHGEWGGQHEIRLMSVAEEDVRENLNMRMIDTRYHARRECARTAESRLNRVRECSHRWWFDIVVDKMAAWLMI